MVVSRDIKAGVIWAGVVGSYEDLYERWRRRTSSAPPGNATSRRGRWRQELAEQYGEPSQNPEFWNSLSATTYITDISGPVQLQHGTADSSVPLEFSVRLADRLKAAGKEVELITYDGEDHNLSGNLRTALNRSVEFFDRYLKI
jgi:dipeptidyl aminopeptidase/acylaminoacyl peptidase